MWSLSKIENPIGSVVSEILTGEQSELYNLYNRICGSDILIIQ